MLQPSGLSASHIEVQQIQNFAAEPVYSVPRTRSYDPITHLLRKLHLLKVAISSISHHAQNSSSLLTNI